MQGPVKHVGDVQVEQEEDDLRSSVSVPHPIPFGSPWSVSFEE